MTTATHGGWKARPRWQRIGIIVVVLIAVAAFVVWIASILLRPHLPTQADVVAGARAQARMSGGGRAFVTHCAYCHERGIAPYLGGRGLDAEAIKGFVRNGPGAMPAFPANTVSDADIADIARYLATFQPKKDAH